MTAERLASAANELAGQEFPLPGHILADLVAEVTGPRVILFALMVEAE